MTVRITASDEHAPERLFTLRTLSDRGYGSARWLYEQCRRGEIPAVRVAGTYKIRESDLGLIAVPVTPEDAA